MLARQCLLAILLATGSAHAQPVPQAAAPAAAPAYTPTFGDLMNTIVQPRHAKLGVAGREANWPLAAYALKELGEALDHVAHAYPRFRGLSVADMVEQVAAEPMREVDEAVKARDVDRFASAYGRLTQGCNACHGALAHAYIVIKPPDASAFPDQDFRAVR